MIFKLNIDQDIDLVFLHHSLADSLFKLVEKDREYLSQWLAWPVHIKAKEDYLPFINDSINKYSEDKALVCAIEYRGKIVGCVSYNSISYSLKKVQVGYWLASDYQGKGIMTRCVDFLTTYAFDTLKMEKVEGSAATENFPSQNVFRRLGFTEEGTITNYENLNGKIVDGIVFGKYAR